ncbi:MAG: polysaccharide deacetylase family protein [Fibrobacter sp.]|nr:polysaccharide deacetylase family protein [Fibrobacter sp.]
MSTKGSKISLAAALVLGSSAAFAQTVEIATWSGFRKAAVSFTFDDNAPSQVNDVAPVFDKYGYKATFNLVTGWSMSGFQDLASNGHEIASHSDSHPSGTMPVSEVASSKQKINAAISQQYGCLTIAYPNCNNPGASEVLQNYIAGRICNGQWQGIDDLMTADGPADWSKAPAIMTGTQGTSDFKTYMQKAVNQGGWVMFLTHGITGKNNGNASYSPTNLSDIESALLWANQNDSYVWVAPFRNVAMYVKERKAAFIDPMDGGNADSYTFELKHSIADNISKYDYPLSLRMAKPTGWENIQVMQENAELEASMADGYIYFDAVPNAGKITVSNMDALSSSSSAEESSSSATTALLDVPSAFPFAVYVSGNAIMVSGAEGMPVTVFNALGHQLRSTKVLGCEQKVFSGAKGLYIVKVGGHAFKVRL